IIRFAVEREETAYQLYKKAAEQSTTIAGRKMFEEMAAEEAGHKQVFSRIDVAALHQQAANRAPDMHLSDYMSDVPLRSDMSYDEILRSAIKAEESAWRLYMAAAEMADDPKLKKTLLMFADVEKGHKKKLEDIYDERVLTEM
ncbi:MAG TPA: ferritin family protein, partial [Geobacteraceae bacterium]